MKDKQLLVANVGDSRCVLCRSGVALDMSIDHKPDDDKELNRIENAGGKVTGEGRVNGGLNLSRALGKTFLFWVREGGANVRMGGGGFFVSGFLVIIV